MYQKRVPIAKPACTSRIELFENMIRIIMKKFRIEYINGTGKHIKTEKNDNIWRPTNKLLNSMGIITREKYFCVRKYNVYSFFIKKSMHER